eukprot:3932111-Rhodomonas_salina.2
MELLEAKARRKQGQAEVSFLPPPVPEIRRDRERLDTVLGKRRRIRTVGSPKLTPDARSERCQGQVKQSPSPSKQSPSPSFQRASRCGSGKLRGLGRTGHAGRR